jgi:hypothetical protein
VTARKLRGILLDVNIGHKFALIIRREYQKEPLREEWKNLALPVLSLSSFGLQDSSPDDLVWDLCQQEGLVLLTCNRNRDGENSLEETIRRYNQPESLPVFTVSNPSRFGTDKEYDARLAKHVLEYLKAIDQLRGTGRLFIPID